MTTASWLRVTALTTACLLAAASAKDAPKPNPNPNPNIGQQPPPLNAGGPVMQVRGVDFNGTDGGARAQFYFQEDGRLFYRDQFGWGENGRWQQDGDKVTITFDGGFATYTGKVIGDLIAGDASNQKGSQWKWTMQKGTPRMTPQFPLSGSTWGGHDSNGCVIFKFAADGAVETSINGGAASVGSYFDDGKWVKVKLADGNTEYFGTLDLDTDTNTLSMTGNFWNSAGDHNTFSAIKDDIPSDCQPGKPQTAQAPEVPSISGLTFVGDNGGDRIEITFGPGGKLTATDSDGPAEGSWLQTGERITFDLNDHFAWYDGTFTGGGLSGDGQNKSGQRWQFSLTKK